MNLASDWRGYLQRNRYTLLAVAVILVIAVVYVLFLASSIFPALDARSALASQLAKARQDLVNAGDIQSETPDTLRQQIADAQAAFAKSANIFVTDSQAGFILNNLYQHARASGVTIVSLETQPDPGQPPASVYRVTTVQLKVQGASRQLVEFLARIKEAALASLTLGNLAIVDSAGLDTLTMTLTIYTSFYSSGEVLSQSMLQPAAAATATAAAPSVEAQLTQRLDALWAAQNWVEAIGVIEQLRALRPADPNLTEKLYAAHVNLGYRRIGEGQIEEARAEFNRALAVKPGGAEASLALSQLAATPTPAARTTVYVVQPGDTLFSLARRFGTSVQAIMEANGLANFNIRVGQQLTIPTP